MRLISTARAGLAAAFVTATTLILAAQQQVFRSSVQFVNVDVVVTTRDDKPVTDLTRDDFEIIEGGKAQKISEFAFVSVPLGHRTIDVDATPAPPSDIASNVESARSSRALVILVDDGSLSVALQSPDYPDVMTSLKRTLTTFLKSLSSDDQVAIIWQSRSDLSQDFTNDIPRLIAGVNSRKAAMGLTPIGPPWRPRVNSLKFAIAALAGSHYARRAIVFVGAAACNPVSPDFEGDECRDLYEKARQGNVPIYPLNPMVLPPSGSADSVDHMAELAINTGGRAFQRQSNPSWAAEQILIENGNFYTLGYYPDPSPSDGKFHEFKVNVKRPGVIVRSRDRYLADTANKPVSTPNRDMTKTLAAGIDDPSLPVRAIVTPLEPALRGLVRTLVTLEVAYPLPDGDSLALNDELRVGIIALTPDAKIKSSFQRPITFTGKWKRTARGTFVINETIDVPSELLTMRVGVTSKALGKSGTAHLTVDVPSYTRTDLDLSPLIIGTSGDAVDAASGLDILRALVPFQPTTQRSFEAGTKLRIYSRAYWRSSDVALTGELRIVGPQGTTAKPVSLPATFAEQGRRRAVLDESITLGNMPPGEYVLSFDAHAGKGKPAHRDVPFTIK